jgi:hypothetical protein
MRTHQANPSFFVILFMAMLLLSNTLLAVNKDSTALKRKLIISLGIGGPVRTYLDNYVHNGSFKSNPSVIPLTNPLYAKIEYRFLHHLGVGVDMSYDDYVARQAPTSSTTFKNEYRGHTFISDLRLNKHFHFFKKRLDLYIGAGVGYEIQAIANIIKTQSLPKINANSISFELTIGGRFYFTKRIGIYIEGGIARSILQGGLAIRI